MPQITFQFDVKSIFLNQYLNENLYVEQVQIFMIGSKRERIYMSLNILCELMQTRRIKYYRLEFYFHKIIFTNGQEN